jgi:Protein of unknown function (DUF3040)
VLSSHERRVWHEIQRSWEADAEETAAERRAAVCMRERARRERRPAPAWTVGAAWGAIFLVLFGAVAAGLAVAAAAGLGWALWRWWSRSTGREPDPATGDRSLSRGGRASTGPTGGPGRASPSRPG